MKTHDSSVTGVPPREFLTRVHLGSATGFTLVELLIASTLLLLISGAVVALALPARDAMERGLATADMTSSARVALEAMVADLREAGAGGAVGSRVRLADIIPVAMALRDLDHEDIASPGSALRVITVRQGSAQAVLEHDVPAGAVSLQLNLAGPCTSMQPRCGFEPEMPAIVYDDSRASQLRVLAVTDTGRLTVAPPVPFAIAAGASVSEIDTVEYGVREDAGDFFDLVRISSGGAVQPLLRYVTDFSVRVDDGAVLLRLRVAAASAALRGGDAALFRQPGHAIKATRWVPDLVLETTVSLRNGR